MMTRRTPLAKLLGLAQPLIQAPMAGVTTVEMAAAATNSGWLGSLAVADLAPAEIDQAVRSLHSRTHSRPFAVNFFVLPDVPPVGAARDQVQAFCELPPVKRARAELGLPATPELSSFAHNYTDQVEAVLQAPEPPAVVSFTFGVLPPPLVARLRERGIVVVGSATTAAEARELESSGVHAVVAQGSEAGGHRATWQLAVEDSLVGTMVLVPQVVDAVKVPVIAAGGVMDGRGAAAALALGAQAVQIGTAFIACSESAASDDHKQTLTNQAPTPQPPTTIMRSFSGRAARGFRVGYSVQMQPFECSVPPYPITNALTKDMRRAAREQGRTDLQSMWAGQGASSVQAHASAVPTAVVCERIARQLGAVVPE